MAEVFGVIMGSCQLLEHVLKLCNGVQTAMDAPQDIFTLNQSLNALKEVMDRMLKRLPEDSATLEYLRGPIQLFEKDLDDIQLRLNKLNAKGSVSKRVRWAVSKQAEFSKVMSNLERYKSLFELAMVGDNNAVAREAITLLQHLRKEIQDEATRQSSALEGYIQKLEGLIRSSESIGQNLQRIAQRSDDDERNKIETWLSPLNFWTKQDDVYSRHVGETGNWIFDDELFKDWLNGVNKTLWCSGIPGAGKTMLASIIINHLERSHRNPDIGIAYIYCSYKANDHTLVNLISSLLKQLIQGKPSMPESIRSSFKSHCGKGTRPKFSEYVGWLRTEIMGRRRVFIVIDALDECFEADGTRAQLMAELHNLSHDPALKVSLIVTSRPSVDETSFGENVPRVEIKATDHDIRTYVEGRLCLSESNLKRLCDKNDDLTPRITQTIVKKSKGMFLLAQLHFESLSRQLNRNKVLKALNTLPSSLDNAYKETMERISSQDGDEKILAHQVLSWVLHALRPLTVPELQHALAVIPGQAQFDPGDITDAEVLVGVCAGLVTIDRQSNVIRLVHYTVQEYFGKTSNKWSPDAEIDITRGCLGYLLSEGFEPLCAQPTPSNHDITTKLSERPFINYAVDYWGIHASHSPEEKIRTCVEEFLHKCDETVETDHDGIIPDFSTVTRICYSGFTPLHFAAHFGLKTFVRSFVQRGVSVDERDTWDRTPLVIAIDRGHVDFVKLLLELGAEINTKCQMGKLYDWGLEAIRVPSTCFDQAVDLADNAFDSSIENVGFWRGTSPLCEAGLAGNQAVIQLLLENGADINGTNFKGDTALHCAVSRNFKDVVQFLIEHGAGVNLVDNNGDSALHEAAFRGYQDVVQVLLEHGADVNLVDNNGESALHFSAQRGHKDVAQVLLDHDADVNLVDNNGQSPLRVAAWHGHKDVVQVLLDHGADVNLVDNNGESALCEAACCGYQNVVQVLLEHGADVNLVDNNGDSALRMAACCGYQDVVQVLLKHGADVNATDKSGRSALHFAAQRGHKDVAQVLLEHGAEINAVDSDGLTPLHHATTRAMVGRQKGFILKQDKTYNKVIYLLVVRGSDLNLLDLTTRDQAMEYISELKQSGLLSSEMDSKFLFKVSGSQYSPGNPQ